MKNLRRILVALAILFMVAIYAFFFVLSDVVGARMNSVLSPPPYTASPSATSLHESLFVADLHADSLLWNRDLLTEGPYGQVDVPRLIKGNVALQAFTVVTKTPSGQNIESNSADASDNITLLAVAQRWPPKTWTSLYERALYQAQKLHDTAKRSNGKLVIIKNKGDLDSFLLKRASTKSKVAGFLGIEGGHCLEGRIENLESLFRAGFRMMGPTHFFDNKLGGSAHGQSKAGLTDFGKQVIQKMEQLNMIVDLAHASPALIDDVLAMATRPVVVSHTGVKGTCDNQRNLSDAHLDGIAKTGGVIGIGYWKTAVCGPDARAIAKAIEHAVAVAGINHVALGSDYDGAIAAPFDTSGLVLITEALQNEGFSDDDIRKIMGANTLRVLKQALPPAKRPQ